jgi:hypothetical protein
MGSSKGEKKKMAFEQISFRAIAAPPTLSTNDRPTVR